MKRPKSPILRVQPLEDRTAPAVFGEAWLDGRHLTLSFAPDGTLISGVGSLLGSATSPLGSQAAKLEILRAFQTWAANANLNIGLVNDNGAAFGSAGAIQTDPRFGDIRIGARILGSDVVAVTAPFSLLTTSSGDFILNGGKSFTFPGSTGTYDLFTVALQEAGHAFGIGSSLDPLSAMYQGYNGAKIGPTGGDLGTMWSLYGARAADALEGAGGNDTLATASTFAGGLEADLTTAQDVDVFRYTADSSAGRWFRLRAAGLSLVSAKLEVLDAAGQVVGSAVATNPLQNDLTVYVPTLVPGATYYLGVSSARSDVFGIGAYRLAADATEAGPAAADPMAPVSTETSANNTLATATVVAPSAGPYDYSFRTTLSGLSDTDYFRIRSPGTNYQHLVVTVAAVGKSNFLPDVDVYSATGVLLPSKIVAQTSGTVVLSLTGVTADTNYVVRVKGGLLATGNYDVAADFRAADLPKMMGANGTLDGSRMSTAGTLNVWQSQTVQLNLLTNLQNGTDFVGLVRIYDYLNRVKFELFSLTGILSTGHVFLGRGSYRVEVKSLVPSAVTFKLTLFGVTDPEGTNPGGDPTDPTGGTGDPPPPPPPDPDEEAKIDPTTKDTTTDPNGITTTITTTYDAVAGTETIKTEVTTLAGTTTTTTAVLQTDIVWF
jgi:hypothetical protein